VDTHFKDRLNTLIWLADQLLRWFCTSAKDRRNGFARRNAHAFPHDCRSVISVYPAQAMAAEFIGTFKEFPPSQKAATFTLGDALEKMSSLATGGGTGKAS
jgi:hypothetical protein